MDDALSESPPKPDDVASNMVKLVELTRKMLSAGDLRPEKFDEKLMIPEDFEAKLEQSGFQAGAAKAADAHNEVYHNGVVVEEPNTSGNGAPVPPTLEVAQLQRTAALLIKENKALKDEVRVLRDKLEQIKKIA
jgi:hypothetical protein